MEHLEELRFTQFKYNYTLVLGNYEGILLLAIKILLNFDPN